MLSFYTVNLLFCYYIPTEVARDSAFPFKEGDKLKIRIEEGGLVITKV
jgi:hypothetical protein